MSRKQKMAEFDQGYNISVTGRHLHVTDPMKAYAIERISKLERLGDRIIDVIVTMDIQKLENKVDITMKYGHTIINSQASTTDMYVSVDQAVDKIAAQLKKYNSRLHDHHGRNHVVEEIPATIWGLTGEEGMTLAEEVASLQEVNMAIEEESDRAIEAVFTPHKIVRRESMPLQVLTDEEAIMKMERSGASALVYRGQEDGLLKFIYRLPDRNFAVIAAKSA
jgi:putative sigma-54 modulation protein